MGLGLEIDFFIFNENMFFLYVFKQLLGNHFIFLFKNFSPSLKANISREMKYRNSYKIVIMYRI